MSRASASRCTDTSRFSRSTSCSGIRAISSPPLKNLSSAFLIPRTVCKIILYVLLRQRLSKITLYTAPMPKRATITKPPLDYDGETIGQRLARLRKQRGYTQVELAEKIGTRQALITAYETDRRALSAEMAVRFAVAMELSTDELLHPKIRKKSAAKPSLKVMRRMEQIEQLPENKQSFILTALDSLLRGAAAR
jgi:transcriptional regulator with XRE-family HTH domain